MLSLKLLSRVILKKAFQHILNHNIKFQHIFLNDTSECVFSLAGKQSIGREQYIFFFKRTSTVSHDRIAPFQTQQKILFPCAEISSRNKQLFLHFQKIEDLVSNFTEATNLKQNDTLNTSRHKD